MSIWSNLRKARTSADLQRQRDDLTATIASHEAELARLKGTLRTGAFDDAKFDPKAIGAQIREADDELTALHGVLEGVETELTAAREREATAALEARAADGRKTRAKLLKDYRELHTLLTRAVALAGDIRGDKAALQALNLDLHRAGRLDLRVPSPVEELAQLLRPAPTPGQVQLPWRGVNDPTEDMHIAGYVPRHPDGPDLDHLARLT